MKHGNDQFDDLPHRPEWSNDWARDAEAGAADGVTPGAPNAGRKLVDFLAELENSQRELAPTPVARGGSVQDVLARAALAVPFADRAERRRRNMRRMVMSAAAVCLAGAVGAAIWVLPGVMTPQSEQSTLGTVVSAAETDFARFMATVRRVKLPEAPAALPRKVAGSVPLPLALELPASSRVASPLAVSIVPMAGSNTEASPMAERSGGPAAGGLAAAASNIGSGIGSTTGSGPVDEPPTEMPH
jgi:hypothetical protein